MYTILATPGIRQAKPVFDTGKLDQDNQQVGSLQTPTSINPWPLMPSGWLSELRPLLGSQTLGHRIKNRVIHGSGP